MAVSAQRGAAMRRPIPKNADTILAFLKAYRNARLNMFIIPFGLTLSYHLIRNLFFFHIPKDQASWAVILSVGFLFVWFFPKGLFSFLGGKARCPQCKATPLVFRKLLGVGPVIGFGIPLFERQIKRCHKCDYPLSLAELEKDLELERQALKQVRDEAKG
jgi:hypothetical protein